MNLRIGFSAGPLIGLIALASLIITPLFGGTFVIQVPRDYTNINAAVAAAGPNGKVVLSPGVYDRSSQNFPIVIPHNLILEGAGTHQSIIDGTGHSGPLIQVDGMNFDIFGLWDFTVRHANNPTSHSAALLIRNSPSMTVANLRFFSNDAPGGRGAAIMIQDSSPVVTNVEFRENAAQEGGAVCVDGPLSAPEFSLCTFIDNSASANGGALMVRNDALGTFTDCEFETNSAGANGGAVHVSSATGLGLGVGPVITNARFYRNEANVGGAVYLANHRLLAESCEFLENDGATNGGAIFTEAASRLDLDRSHIARNTVDQHIVVIQGSGDISNSMFYRNTTQSGGVLRFEGAGVTARVVHNTFTYNNIGGPITTGAISHNLGTPQFQNNIVAFNDAVGYAEANFNSDPVFRNNLFWANTDGGYLDEGVSILNTAPQFLVINNPQPATGMVIQNPNFRDEGVNNFRLNPASPAINAGAAVAGIASLDIDLENRAAGLSGTSPDMGADEQLAPRLVTPPFWFDKFFNGFGDAGDELVLQFNEPMQINATLIESDFTFPVTGDSLGTTFTAVVNAENPTQVVLTLSGGARIVPNGTFSNAALTSGSASGFELATAPRAGVLVSARTGLDARRTLTGTNAHDIVYALEPNNSAFAVDNTLPQELQVGGSGYFTKNKLEFPPGSLLFPVSILLAPRFEFAEALSAMHISQVGGVIVINPDQPARLTMQYEPLELNAESDEFEKRLRIFVRKQTIFGPYEFRPVEDATGGIQQVDTVNNTISVYVDELIPQDINFGAAPASGETAIQANNLAIYMIAPLEAMPEDSELISPSSVAASGDPIKSAVVIEPPFTFDPLPEVYYRHQMDLPNFDADALSNRGATLQTAANRFERDELERTGLPPSNFTVAEILSWENDPSNRIEFLDIGNLRQQYIPHPEIDLRDPRGYTASPHQLELLRYDPQDGFVLPGSGTALLNGQSSTVTQDSLLNPAPSGRGIYALIANAAKTFTYAFDQGEEGWRQQDAPRAFLTPNFIAGSGRLGLGSRGVNTFGAWVSPENIVTAQPDKLLKMRFSMSSTDSDASVIPSMRLRLNSENLDSALVLQLISDHMGTSYPTNTTPVDYEMFFEAPWTAIGAAENENGVNVAFDITHFDPFDSASTWLYMDNFETEFLDKKAFDAGFSVSRNYTFLFGADGWVSSGPIGTMTQPLSGYDFGRDALYLQATDALTFGFWTTNSGVTIQPNTIYRVTFWVYTNEGNLGDGIPTFRMRVADGITATQTLEVNSTTGGYSPLTIPQTYQVYYLPPAGLSASGRSLILGFDILNFNPFDNVDTRIFLDRVLIEERPY